jgi:hypothetical protein
MSAPRMVGGPWEPAMSAPLMLGGLWGPVR